MNIDMNALFVSLEILWKGLLAIAIVMIAIITVTDIMNAISSASQKKKSAETDANKKE